jgi:hypothetical protein
MESGAPGPARQGTPVLEAPPATYNARRPLESVLKEDHEDVLLYE